VVDPTATIVAFADTSNVDSVFVAGRAVKRSGKLVGVDLPGTFVQLDEARNHVLGASELLRVGARRRTKPASERVRMKAVGFDEFGGPEVLRVVELPDPEPGPDDAVVSVRAVSVGRTLDVAARAGGSRSCVCGLRTSSVPTTRASSLPSGRTSRTSRSEHG